MLAGGEIGHTGWSAARCSTSRSTGGWSTISRRTSTTLIVNDTTVITAPQLVTGVRESTLGADAGATFSVKVSQVARLYAVYDGRFRSNLTSHAGTVGAEFRW